ncbi:MAG: flagellar hook protein [Betaproteobacteria bacterium HGW-Betaproteobacteria-7]|jgi:flagellar hook-associated protein 2|nr:MAG: flagellar hook protein [Betaproteobacteria bacterium HGW-Betaproteobacteria-7]
MAGSISSLGIGTGLDANSIVSKLMSLEQIPLTALNAKTTAFNAKLSSFGQLKSALSTLQTAAKTLADPNKLAAYTATAADTEIVKAQANFFASAGTYSVEVLNLASAQKRYSNTAYASSTSFGAGTLTFNVNGVDKDVELTGSNSLIEVRAAINAANTGVTASIISGDSGDRLVLTSTTEGTAGAFTLSVNSADANLQSLASFDLANPFSTNAQDAQAKIDGILVTSSTNTLSTAVNGLTLTLTKVGTTQLTVAKDTGKVSEAVNTFVKAFNDVITRVKSESAYDTTTKTGKPLNAESTVRSVMQILAGARTTVPASLSGTPFETLSTLGISIQKDGQLVVDSTKLTAAINTDSAAVENTLGAYGTAFSNALESIVSSTGLIANREDGIKRSISLLGADKERLQFRLDSIEKRYRAQFTALDTLVSSLQTTGSYLSQQLASLNNNS